MSVPSISATELKALLDKGAAPYVLDVRERMELLYGAIPGYTWIPMRDVANRMGDLPKGKRIVVYCHTGGRSEAVAGMLQQKGYDAWNLTGGIMSWGEFDSKVKQY